MNFNLELGSLSNISLPKIRNPKKLIAIIMAIVGIVLWYWTTNTKLPEIESQTQKLTTQNKSLSTKENELTVLYNSMEFYLNETDRLITETDDFLKEFPTFMYLEDKILYAKDLSEGDLAKYNLASFSYGQSTYQMSVNYGKDNTLMELYSVGLSGRYTNLTYAGVKDLLNYGLTSPQRFVLKNITIGFNQDTGYLNGEFSFNTFFIPGQPTPYEFPQDILDKLSQSNRINDLFGARTN